MRIWSIQELDFNGTVSFSYQIAFLFFMPKRKNLKHRIVKCWAHDPKPSTQWSHQPSLPFLGDRKSSLFPTYTWELAPFPQDWETQPTEFSDFVTVFLVVQHIPYPTLRVSCWLSLSAVKVSCGLQFIISQARGACLEHLSVCGLRRPVSQSPFIS